jgi:hypothetical protein
VEGSATDIADAGPTTAGGATTHRVSRRLFTSTTARSWLRGRTLWESATVTLLTLAPELWLRAAGVSVLARDTLNSNMPLKQMAIDQLADGRLPLWTSKLAAGFPLLADSVSIPFDPREIWYAFLSPDNAYLAMLLTGQVMGALLMYWYLRRRHGIGFFAALVGSFVYLHAGILFDEARLHSTAIAIDLLPGAIWLTDRLLERPGVKRALHLALFWGLLVLMASAAYGAFVPIVCFVWAVFVWAFGRRRRWRQLRSFTLAYLGAGVWGTALGAWAILPFVQFVSQSNRGGEYLEDGYFYRSVVYGLFGTHQTSVLVPPWTAFFYFGTIALALAIVACGRSASAYLRGLPWLALGGFTLVALLETPLKPKIGAVFPFILSIPVFRLSFFPVFVSAVLVAYGLDRLDWDLERWRRWLVRFLLGMQCVVLAALALAACLVLVLKKEELAEGYVPLYDNSIAYLRPAISASLLAFVTIRAVGLWLTLLDRHPLLKIRRRSARASAEHGDRADTPPASAQRAPTDRDPGAARRWLAREVTPRRLAGVMLLVELTLAWTTLRPLVYERGAVHPFPVTPEVAYLQRHENADGRAMEIENVPGAGPIKPASSHDSISLFLDAPAFHAISTANVYESLVVQNYSRFFRHFPGVVATGRAPTALLLMSDPNSRLLDALGVRWIYTDAPLPPSNQYALRLEGVAYDVYERLDTVPRAFFVGRAQRLDETETQAALQAAAVSAPSAPDLGREVLLPGAGSEGPTGPPSYAPAEITRDDDSTVSLRVRAPTSGYVFLADTMYPGWTASVDGHPARIELADGYARAVRVGPGAHTITYTYRPAPFRVGLLITLIALAVSLVALVWWSRRPSRTSAVQEHGNSDGTPA